MGEVSSVVFARSMLESCENRAAGEGNQSPAYRKQRRQTRTKDRCVCFRDAGNPKEPVVHIQRADADVTDSVCARQAGRCPPAPGHKLALVPRMLPLS